MPLIGCIVSRKNIQFSLFPAFHLDILLLMNYLLKAHMQLFSFKGLSYICRKGSLNQINSKIHSSLELTWDHGS